VSHGVKAAGGSSDGGRKHALGRDREELAGVGERGVEVLGGVDGQEVGEQAGSVGRGHGGTGDGAGGGGAAAPGREDVETRSEDVNALAVVREVGALVSESGGTNSDGALSSRGRVVARVAVIITYSKRDQPELRKDK
jgi:hypothetical protein